MHVALALIGHVRLQRADVLHNDESMQAITHLTFQHQHQLARSVT